ncbi:MAG: hypothetical protein ABEJ97_09770, partial [Halobellus sp.]
MTTSSTIEIPLDSVFTHLADRLRRYLLYCLFQDSNPMSLPRIADRAVEWRTGEPAEAVLDARLEIYMQLYHDHLSGLIEDDVITYHQDEDLVVLDTAAGVFEPYVAQAFRDEIDT